MFALAGLALVAACGGKSSPKEGGGESKEDAGPKEPPPLRKVLHIGLEYVVLDPDVDPPTSRVSLIFTDETGASRREVIGQYPGGCSDVSPAARAEAIKPILGLDCWAADSGVHLRFVYRRSKLYVVIAKVERPDQEPSYQPLKTIDIPVGTPVATDYGDPPK